MPKKGYKHSIESRKKMSESLFAAHARKKFGFNKNNKEKRFTGKKHSDARAERLIWWRVWKLS